MRYHAAEAVDEREILLGVGPQDLLGRGSGEIGVKACGAARDAGVVLEVF